MQFADDGFQVVGYGEIYQALYRFGGQLYAELCKALPGKTIEPFTFVDLEMNPTAGRLPKGNFFWMNSLTCTVGAKADVKTTVTFGVGTIAGNSEELVNRLGLPFLYDIFSRSVRIPVYVNTQSGPLQQLGELIPVKPLFIPPAGGTNDGYVFKGITVHMLYQTS